MRGQRGHGQVYPVRQARHESNRVVAPRRRHRERQSTVRRARRRATEVLVRDGLGYRRRGFRYRRLEARCLLWRANSDPCRKQIPGHGGMRRPGVRLNNSVGHQVARRAISRRSRARTISLPSSRTSDSADCTPPTILAGPISFASSTGSMSAGSKCRPRAGRIGFRRSTITGRP